MCDLERQDPGPVGFLPDVSLILCRTHRVGHEWPSDRPNPGTCAEIERARS